MRRRPGLYADIPVPVLQVHVGEDFFFGFCVFLVHPNVVSVQLSALVERFDVSRMRDFYNPALRRGIRVPPAISYLLLIAVMSSLFPCFLLKKEVNCSQMETDQLTLEAWWLNIIKRLKRSNNN